MEITRLLWVGAGVLILDEPTTGISSDQRDLLFATLRAAGVQIAPRADQVGDVMRQALVG